ncbi:hypothetical protein M0657_008814, partial [Pyricularia oryzae]
RPGKEQTTRGDIKLSAQNLTTGFLQEKNEEVWWRSMQSQDVMLPDEVVVEMEKWMKTPASKWIWVEAPVDELAEKRLTCAAFRIAEIVLNSGMVCIYFFASARPTWKGSSAKDSWNIQNSSRKEEAATALLYSLITQLVRLPRELDRCPPDLCRPDAFDSLLDLSIPPAARHAAALGLIRTLLDHAPKALVLVVDAVHLADCAATRRPLADLLGMLRERGRSLGHVVKVLFTTVGSCALLAANMQRGERVDAERMALARPGLPLRGWSQISGPRGLGRGPGQNVASEDS